MTGDGIDEIRVFDRRAVRRHRARAARIGTAEFLFEEAAAGLAERLDDVTRKFSRALVLGSRRGTLQGALTARGGLELLVESDDAPGFLAPPRASARVAAEAEALPFAAGSFDLVLSPLALHWTNDLPGALLQLRHALKPDGLLLAAAARRRDAERAAPRLLRGRAAGGRRRQPARLADGGRARSRGTAAARGLRAAGGRQRPHHRHLSRRLRADGGAARHGRDQRDSAIAAAASPGARRCCGWRRSTAISLPAPTGAFPPPSRS